MVLKTVTLMTIIIKRMTFMSMALVKELKIYYEYFQAKKREFCVFTEALETERKKESQEDSVETFEMAFERIKEMTGLEDLDELVRR
jgi:hypothetical protein